jgi:hypothetical protein
MMRGTQVPAESAAEADDRLDRDLILEYLERQLMGPLGGPEEELEGEAPHKRYLTGILFPREPQSAEELAEELDESNPAGAAEDGLDDPIAMAGQLQPSSVGLTFVTEIGAGVVVELGLARYHRDGSVWLRNDCSLNGESAVRLTAGQRRMPILGGNASLDAVWRPAGTRQIVTVSLVNRAVRTSAGGVDGQDCLLQTRLRCTPDIGHLHPYPAPALLTSDPEEEELNLLYRNVPTYALGHGAAAHWGGDGGTEPTWAETAFVPRAVVPGVLFDLPGAGDVLGLAFLAGMRERPEECIQGLRGFIANYRAWHADLVHKATVLPAPHRPAADRLLSRIDQAAARMDTGVDLLERDPLARRAFAEANRAMLMQMIRSGESFTGTRRHYGDPVPTVTEYTDPTKRWRPFQLAFQLMTLESVVDEDSDFRDLVDLIWFPTGGGKTEAYLGLVAFTILHRRLRLGDRGAGTTVITRYTLRLLTAQQFQRAATLVCALELLRRREPAVYGSVPISIGLWVGSGNTPNTYADALELLEKIRSGVYSNQSFQLDLCPWCGTETIPSDLNDEHAFGVAPTNNSVRMRCPNASCDFSERLPVATVDQAIYDEAPTVVVGTVDKFARLAWEEHAGVLLGSGDLPGPSLVIQDEFHLISGPLGTMVAAYEAAFDAVMAANGGRPKVVASTATIRRASQQAAGVFARPVALFPPSGLDADDSYFVRFDRQTPGRLYVGVMPQAHTPLTAMVHVSAALLQAPEEMPLRSPADDAYWTLVAYHNSLRELGKSITLAHDDIRSRLGVIATAEDGVRALPDDAIVELTSNVPAAEIPGKIETLKKSRGEPGCPGFVASSNMISVGVDVSRLGLMLVVGQPKSTSEYIQASSRVGRSVPGLVVTLFSPSKPRDRSHYESFVPYHAALYRSVEPTSVTPFSAPARARALHAALVILARHAGGYPGNAQAGLLDATADNWQVLMESFIDRARVADPAEASAVEAQIEALLSEWDGMKAIAASSGGLRYSAAGRQFTGLLKRFGAPGDGWPTLDSMRNVDAESRIWVKGEQS